MLHAWEVLCEVTCPAVVIQICSYLAVLTVCAGGDGCPELLEPELAAVQFLLQSIILQDQDR